MSRHGAGTAAVPSSVIGAEAVLAAEPDLVPAVGGRRWVVLHRLMGVADVLGGLLAAGITGMAVGLPADRALVLAGLCAVLLPIFAFVCGLYAADDLRSWATGVPDVRLMLFTTLAVSWPVLFTADALGLQRPGLATLVMAVATFSLVSTGRAVARAVAHRAEHLQERTGIVGSGVVAAQLVRNLRRHPELGLVPVGVIDNAEHHRAVADLPHLGGVQDISTILRREGIDRVIIAFSRAGHVELLQAIRACRDNRVPVHVVPRLFELLDGARALDQVGGMPILSLGVPRLTGMAQAAKRSLDVAVSAAALVAFAPVFAAIAVAIKLESPGPVLFRQLRGGRRASAFALVKFRSMHPDADERKAELLDRNEMAGGIMFKIRSDPRITRVGRILRRFSLDELPQLWNVLRGDMSLVGPRPLVPDETEGLDQEWHLRRGDLRPGLTGPWQIYGRSEIPFPDMVRFDYQYVAGWSLARDLEILFATVPAVLSGRGAY